MISITIGILSHVNKFNSTPHPTHILQRARLPLHRDHYLIEVQLSSSGPALLVDITKGTNRLNT